MEVEESRKVDSLSHTQTERLAYQRDGQVERPPVPLDDPNSHNSGVVERYTQSALTGVVVNVMLPALIACAPTKLSNRQAVAPPAATRPKRPTP